MIKKVSLVVIPIDDFTDEIITKERVALKVNGMNRDIIKKQEGFLIITNLEETIIKLSVSAYSFIPVELEVNLAEIDRLEPILRVSLKPNEKYNFSSEVTCIKGETVPETEILIINVNKENTFRLLEDINVTSKNIKIYNPLNINLERRKIVFKEDTEEYEYNEILEFDTQEKRYLLKQDILKEHKKDNTKVIKGELVKADEKGSFFIPLKNINDKVYLKTEDEVLHNVVLEKGRVNFIKLN